MPLLKKCSECAGEGEYKIYNVYNPNYAEDCVCEYCDGEGFVPEISMFNADTSADNDWLN